MEKRLKNYLAYMAEFVEKDHSDEEYERGYRDLMIQIAFFQHERLIHLIVTVTFALLALIGITAALATPQIPLLILVMLFIVLLVPYVRHYYILENGVQELYRRYDTIVTHIPTENRTEKVEKEKQKTKEGEVSPTPLSYEERKR